MPVRLMAWEVAMSERARPGPVAFRVTNRGSRPHGFVVERRDIDGFRRGFDGLLEPGETRHLKMDLTSGTYEIYCPAKQHAVRGMRLLLRVE